MYRPAYEGRQKMRKVYQAPVLRTRTLQLGVFGDYGQGGGDDHEPRPIRVVNGFELTLD
jgi:hypothetical protein